MPSSARFFKNTCQVKKHVKNIKVNDKFQQTYKNGVCIIIKNKGRRKNGRI